MFWNLRLKLKPRVFYSRLCCWWSLSPILSTFNILNISVCLFWKNFPSLFLLMRVFLHELKFKVLITTKKALSCKNWYQLIPWRSKSLEGSFSKIVSLKIRSQRQYLKSFEAQRLMWEKQILLKSHVSFSELSNTQLTTIF
mgnify:CR=1 FL=1